MPAGPLASSHAGVLYETGAAECRFSTHDGFSSACQIRFAKLPLLKSDDVGRVRDWDVYWAVAPQHAARIGLGQYGILPSNCA